MGVQGFGMESNGLNQFNGFKAHLLFGLFLMVIVVRPDQELGQIAHTQPMGTLKRKE